MSNRRLLLAFGLAPLLPSIIVVFAFRITSGSAATFALFFSLIFSYLPCLIFGAPLIRVLKIYNALTVPFMVLFGGALGAIVYYGFGILLSELFSSPRSLLPNFKELCWGGLLGSSVALAFSLIAGFPLFHRGIEKGGV